MRKRNHPGAEFRAFRKAHKMSAFDVTKRLAGLGLPLIRDVHILEFERGEISLKAQDQRNIAAAMGADYDELTYQEPIPVRVVASEPPVKPRVEYVTIYLTQPRGKHSTYADVR